MTAIAGMWRFDGKPDAAERCARMITAQRLYGPHAEAHWSNGAFSVGWCQMRMLPEDIYDRQPLIGSAGRYVLVADVRLDNRDDLVRELCIPFEKGRESSDAMILLAAIERWGDNCFDHIVGVYAFALWDSHSRHLMLARDALGERPLHFHQGEDFVAFSSMPSGLHALPEIPRRAREGRAAVFLLQPLGNGWQSYFEGIDRVHTGHVVTIKKGSTKLRRHWNLHRRTKRLGRTEDYIEAAREILDRAVSCRLRGTGDVGVQLSGGLDSSGIAATSARLLAPSGRKVIAFTSVPNAGFADSSAAYSSNYIIDEGTHAAAVAALYPNMEHVLVHNGGRRLFDDLDRSFSLSQEPPGGVSNIGWYYSINDAARKRGLGILLTGETGNYGLSYDGATFLPELLRQGNLLRLWHEAKAIARESPVTLRTALAWAIGPWCPVPLWRLLNKLRGREHQDIRQMSPLNPAYDLRSVIRDKKEISLQLLDDRPERDGFSFRKRVITEGYDQGNFRKGVLAGWQIDMRDPTADVRLLEFCLSIPSDLYLANGRMRAFGRSVLADRLPELVLEEQRKGYQSADWHEHLTAARSDIVAELDRLQACPLTAKLLDIPRLRELVQNWDVDCDWDVRTTNYLIYLLTAISVGHFVRLAEGDNS